MTVHKILLTREQKITFSYFSTFSGLMLYFLDKFLKLYIKVYIWANLCVALKVNALFMTHTLPLSLLTCEDDC